MDYVQQCYVRHKLSYHQSQQNQVLLGRSNGSICTSRLLQCIRTELAPVLSYLYGIFTNSEWIKSRRRIRLSCSMLFYSLFLLLKYQMRNELLMIFETLYSIFVLGGRTKLKAENSILLIQSFMDFYYYEFKWSIG